jgi:rod shape-determining protein MreD
MKAVGVLVVLVGALALQTTISGLTLGGARMVNLVVVAVVYVALLYGPVAGLMAGTFGGLVQDALGGGVVGSAACRRPSSASCRGCSARTSSCPSRCRGW